MAFSEEYLPKKIIIVCNEKEKRIHGNIMVLPWSNFLRQLWDGKIL